MKILAETERLVLREILSSDDQAMFELDSDPEVHRYLGNKAVKTIHEAQEVVASIRRQYVENGIGRWAVIEKETGVFMGWSGLKLITETINNHTHYYDLGYRLMRKHWGKGIASESAMAALQYGFSKLQLKTIYAITDAGNSSSEKVLAKLGFQRTGSFDYGGIPHHWYQLGLENQRYFAKGERG